MTSSRQPLTARFEVEYNLRVGPKMTDYRLMAPGETIPVTDEIKAYNRTGGQSIFDVEPRVQERHFGRVILRVGHFPETSDPAAQRWYRPLTSEPEFAEIDHSVPRTSRTTVYYGGSK